MMIRIKAYAHGPLGVGISPHINKITKGTQKLKIKIKGKKSFFLDYHK
jgi:hypothetical protein